MRELKKYFQRINRKLVQMKPRVDRKLRKVGKVGKVNMNCLFLDMGSSWYGLMLLENVANASYIRKIGHQEDKFEILYNIIIDKEKDNR